MNFAEWLPDQPAFENAGATEAKNVIPAVRGYRALQDLGAVSTAATSDIKASPPERPTMVTYQFMRAIPPSSMSSQRRPARSPTAPNQAAIISVPRNNGDLRNLAKR